MFNRFTQLSCVRVLSALGACEMADHVVVHQSGEDLRVILMHLKTGTE